MQRVGGRIVYSASDLNHYVECPHILELDKLVMGGGLARPERTDRVEIIAEYGEQHERSYLDTIIAGGYTIVTIERSWGEPGWAAGASETEAAMAKGAPFIAQATFYDGEWLGYADIIRRVEEPCARWPWSYEAVDAKLARADKPYFILQLCCYTEQLQAIQGTAPKHMWLYLGSREERSYRYADFEAYYRRVKERFLTAVRKDTHTYPLAVGFCEVCRYAQVCADKRLADDHPSLVAYARRDQLEKLASADPPTTTMTALAAATDLMRPTDLAQSSFDRLRRQAAIQVRSRDASAPVFELLPVEIERGLALLPPVSEGDVFFDMEGDPFAEGGLEYLFGIVTVESGSPAFTGCWADGAQEEKACFERFIDFVADRRKRYPDMHVYHYAAYEPAALKRLMILHMTREKELDELLRGQVFVDLLTAVRQGLIVPAYSIKDLEHFYWARGREGGVTTAIDSVLTFERWRRDRQQSDKDQILAYNRIDCESTFALRDWLLQRRDEAFAMFGPPAPPPERERNPTKQETLDFRRRQEELARALAARLPKDPSAFTPDLEALSLLSHLVYYHRREAKPVWWEFFERCSQTPEELVEDGTAIGEIRPHARFGPTPVKKSLEYVFEYPPQQHRIMAKTPVCDGYGAPAGTVVEIDDDAGSLTLRRGNPIEGGSLPKALIPNKYISTQKLEQALCEFAADELAALDGAAPIYRAGRSILYRKIPHIEGIAASSPLQSGAISTEQIKLLCRALDESHLFIQGPPGSGKTYTGARLVVDLLQQGRRIAVSANSHKAINNMLAEIEEVAAEEKCSFRGVKIVGTDEDDLLSSVDNSMIERSRDRSLCLRSEVDLVAGTAWLFTDPDLRRRFDYLFIDEAGQVSLANALAMSVAAKNVVLLGDPLQLAQVSRGAQPEGAQVSVLEHLLGSDPTIPPERGVFLTVSYRMHPEICRFISETIYDGRLVAVDGSERQRLDALGLEGAGLRFVPVDHDGDPMRSRDEAVAAARVVARALKGTVTDRSGDTRPMTTDDVLVVAPYNAQVKTIRDAFDRRDLDEVRVGTVDKFQGQQAAVVIYSMATPSASDVPHGLEFLFSQNRLNVAISRAKCWSVIVASPRLLDAGCRTVDQMRLVNTLCKFVEIASREREV
jgi:predicted RecB family nuclease